jgi:hypothetical protein
MIKKYEIEKILKYLGLSIEIVMKENHYHIRFWKDGDKKKNFFRIQHKKMTWWEKNDNDQSWLFFNILYRYVEKMGINLKFDKVECDYSYQLDVFLHHHARKYETLRMIYLLFSLEIQRLDYDSFSFIYTNPPKKIYLDFFESWFEKKFNRKLNYSEYQ